MLESWDTVCGDCFTERGYLVCRNCGVVYNPEYCSASGFGFCVGCEEELIGFCSRCENVFLREQLGITKDDEYLCALCANKDLTEIIEDPSLFKFTVDDYEKAYEEGWDAGYDFGFEAGVEEAYKKIIHTKDDFDFEIQP